MSLGAAEDTLVYEASFSVGPWGGGGLGIYGKAGLEEQHEAAGLGESIAHATNTRKGGMG